MRPIHIINTRLWLVDCTLAICCEKFEVPTNSALKMSLKAPSFLHGRPSCHGVIPRSVNRGYPWIVLHSISKRRSQMYVLCHLVGLLKTMRWTKRLPGYTRFHYQAEWASSSRASAQAGFSSVLKWESHMHYLGGICDLCHITAEVAMTVSYCAFTFISTLMYILLRQVHGDFSLTLY
jgi:hypothetical protein